jgi:hypothetical protein
LVLRRRKAKVKVKVKVKANPESFLTAVMVSSISAMASSGFAMIYKYYYLKMDLDYKKQ